MDLKLQVATLRIQFDAWRIAHPGQALKEADSLDAELTIASSALDTKEDKTAQECYDEAKRIASAIGVLDHA